MRDANLVPADVLRARVRAALAAAGADEASAEAATRALMHASLLGVDSHGVRLVPHYARVLRGGRVNGQPRLRAKRTGASCGIVEGDDGLGHLVAYQAVALALQLARETGIGAVGAVRSSHFGAAGAYALAAAEQGMIGFATANSDAIVALFGGAEPFHGTNPLAFAAPVKGVKPWLVDMATSSIPLNRVHLYRSLGQMLPEGVAAAEDGTETRDADAARMLLPLGGRDFGFKGAALAGVATMFAAALQGAPLDHELAPMIGDDATPRNIGHFFLVVDPARFVGADVFAAAMARYLAALRGQRSRPGHEVLAPGEREWRVEAKRLREGVPVDPDTLRFLGVA